MFDIGGTELLVIAVVAILVVRPKDLPTMLRTIGQYVGKLRAMARDFQNQFEEAARETGMDDIRQGISSVKDMNPTNKMREAMSSFTDEMESVKTDLENPSVESKPETPKDGAGEAPAEKTETKPKAPAKKPAAKKKTARKTPAKSAKASTEG